MTAIGEKQAEIYTYEAPWLIYAANWSVRRDKRFRLAVGSFVEEYGNRVEIITLDEERGAFPSTPTQAPEGRGTMLYQILPSLSDDFGALRLFQFITFRTGGAMLTALVISLLLGSRIIAWLRSMQGAGQPIRADGP